MPTRLRIESGEGARGDGYDFYPSLGHLENEFEKICAEQQKHHPDLLGDDVIQHLRTIMFCQRPLKAVVPGKCSYNPEANRLPKARPLFRNFSLIKEIIELALIGEVQVPIKLYGDQRDALLLHLRGVKFASFSPLKRRLKVGSEFHFNKESDGRKKLTGDEVGASLSRKNSFGNRWPGFDVARQWEIVSRLRDTEDPHELQGWLIKNGGLSQEQA